MSKQKKLTRKPKTPPKKSSKFNRKPFSKINLGLFLIIVGIILILIPLLFFLNESIQLSIFTPKVKAVPVNKIYSPKPTRITIPDVKVDLAVFETSISSNIWEIASTGASHLKISATPGQKGAIIIYGHNTNNRFGPIQNLRDKELIDIKTADGKLHKYIIYKTTVVSPDRVDVFNVSKETLILYTCTGFADLKRFVVFAKPLH